MQQAREVAIAGLYCGGEDLWWPLWHVAAAAIPGQGCYCAVWGCVNSSLQLSSGSVVTVSGGSDTVGAHGQKKGESYSQGIRGSVGSLCLWGDNMNMSL